MFNMALVDQAARNSAIEESLKHNLQQDLIFECADGSVRCSRILLMQISPYISQMLASANPVANLGIGGGYDTNIIICPELKSITVKKLCNLLTTGVSDIKDSAAVAELVDSAKLLGISLNNVSLEPLAVVAVESFLEQELVDGSDNNQELESDQNIRCSESFHGVDPEEEHFKSDNASSKKIVDDNTEISESKKLVTSHCCPICMKPFNRKNHVLEHLARSHFRKELLALVDSNKEPYTCLECGKHFEKDFGYARHLGVAHKMLAKVIPPNLLVQDFKINWDKSIVKSNDLAHNQCLKRGPSDKIEDQAAPKKFKEGNDNFDDDMENKNDDSNFEGYEEPTSKACPICKKVYSKTSGVMTHLCLDHFKQDLKALLDKNDPSRCIDCGVRIPYSHYLIKHIGCTHKRLLEVIPKELMIELRKLFKCKGRARKWRGLW